MFHLAYEENEKQCNTIAVPDGFLKSDECILRVSPLIKTDFGNGRLALTDKRYCISTLKVIIFYSL